MSTMDLDSDDFGVSGGPQEPGALLGGGGPLWARSVRRSFRPGASLFRQEDPCEGLLWLDSGTVAIRLKTPRGRDCLIRLVEAGEVLGWRACLGDGETAHLKSAVAITEVEAHFVRREHVLQALGADPALTLSMLQTLTRAAMKSEAERTVFMDSTARARLAHVLIGLRDHHGWVDDAGDLIIDLPISRQDIASAIGVRPETVSRLVEALSQDGIAEFNGRRVRVPDLDGLLDEVEEP
jgi:CRP/FNR family transcriptional regulator